MKLPHITNAYRIIKNVLKALRCRLKQRLLHRYLSDNQIRTMSKKYYETEYRQANWLEIESDYRNNAINRIKETQGCFKSILDIGCGDGKALASLNFKDKTGVDISRKLLHQALKRDSTTRVVLVDAEHLPFVNKAFDMVILLDIIEHVLDPKGAFEEARRVACSEIVLTTDYGGVFEPSRKGQVIDRVPKLKFLRTWGELTFFNDGKSIPFWKGLLFANGIMVRTRFKERKPRSKPDL